MQCEAEAIPDYSLTYFYNGSPLPSNAVENGALILSNVTSADNGVYQCFAENIHGSASASWNVMVTNPSKKLSILFCMYTGLCLCACTCVCVCVCIRVHGCCVCACVGVCACACVCTCACACACVCVWYYKTSWAAGVPARHILYNQKVLALMLGYTQFLETSFTFLIRT